VSPPLAGSFPPKKSTKIYSDQGRVLAWALLFAWTFSPVAGSNPIRSKQGLSAVLKVFFFPLFPVLLILSFFNFFLIWRSSNPASPQTGARQPGTLST
jgi:hypothetical protein